MKQHRLQLTAGHPRLFITPRELPHFRKMSAGPRRAYRDQLLERLQPVLPHALALRERMGHGPEWLALALGEAWQITRDEKYARAGRWLMEALEWFIHAKPTGYDTWGVAAEAAGILYDWMNDYWRDRNLAEQAASITLYCARRALDETLNLYIVDDWHNYSLGLQSGALAGALAVGYEHPKLEDGSLLSKMHALHFTGLRVKATFLQDMYPQPETTRCLEEALSADHDTGFGMQLESTGAYHSVDGWELMKIATWWTSASRAQKLVWPQAEKHGETILYFERDDGSAIVFGDGWSRGPHTRQANILLHLQARTPRPYFAAWLAKHASLASTSHLLLCAEKFTPDPNAITTLPTAARFDPLTVLRSSWKRNGTVVAFRCGKYGGGHNHLDHLSFTIFRGGPLAVDSGGMNYGAPGRTEYALRTLSHNCIVVRNPAEPHWLGRHEIPVANDGGQRLVYYSYAPPNESAGRPHAVVSQQRRRAFPDEFDMGHYVAFESGKHIDYVAGDGTRAYTYPWSGLGDNPSRRVEEAVRQLVFLKPDLIVIFDRVEATRANFEKKFLLHTIGGPTVFVRGSRRRIARGIHPLPASGPYEYTQQRGRLTVWPLLPQARRVRVVGGKGFDCWVDHAVGAPNGRNYPEGGKHRDSGNWRTEISPAKNAARDCFLTVLHAGLKRETPASKTFAFETQLESGTVALSILKDSRPWAELRFRTAGAIETDVSYHGELLHHTAPAPERVPMARTQR